METRGPDISHQGQAVIKIVAQTHYNTSTTTEGEKNSWENVWKPSILEYCHCNHDDPVQYRRKNELEECHNILKALNRSLVCF